MTAPAGPGNAGHGRPGGGGHSPGDSAPELSSMAATLAEVARRVSTMAEAVAGTDDDRLRWGRSGPVSISQELYEVERALAQAVRRLEALTDALRQQAPDRD